MVNQHFFQPLLPGFHSHLTIPIAFFSKHIEGGNEHKTRVRLRSDASGIPWEVKIEDGQKLTDGWKEFALAHDLRVGDIVIFRQEKDMTFHVTLFGPSCCEIQYGSCLKDKNKLRKIQSKKKVKKKNKKRYVDSSSVDPSCFVNIVRPSSLLDNRLTLPKSFVRANGLETRCGEIVLMNEKGKAWNLNLQQRKSLGTISITGGWTSFCRANGLKAGSLFTFKLIKRGETLVLLKSPSSTEFAEEGCLEDDETDQSDSEEETNLEKTQSKKTSERNAESSLLEPSCYMAIVTPSGLRHDRLILGRSFVRENDLDERCGEIVLMNEKGTSWALNLNRKNSSGVMSITGGWRLFCRANGLRAGSFFSFKLIQTRGALVLRLSSQLQNRFVTLTLKPYNLKRHLMFLPTRFTKMHGVNEETKMTMLDKNGVKWSTDLRCFKIRPDRIRMVGGWKEFFKANCVETGESIIVKLIWEGNTSCVLKFCSKVKQDTN